MVIEVDGGAYDKVMEFAYDNAGEKWVEVRVAWLECNRAKVDAVRKEYESQKDRKEEKSL